MANNTPYEYNYTEFARQLKKVDSNVSAAAVWSTVANLGRAFNLLNSSQAERETFSLDQLTSAVSAGPTRLGLNAAQYEALRETVEKLKELDER